MLPLKWDKLTKFGPPGSKNERFSWNLVIFRVFFCRFCSNKLCLEGQKWSKRVSRGQEWTHEISIPLKLGKLTKFGLPGSKNTDFCWNLMIFGAFLANFEALKACGRVLKGQKRFRWDKKSINPNVWCQNDHIFGFRGHD